MAISNEKVVDTTSKYIVKSTGNGSETDQVLVNANDLTGGTNESLVCLVECFYLTEGTGKLTTSAETESDDLVLTGKGKYGLRPEQLRFGNDKKMTLTTDSNVKSYLLVTEFRRK